MLCKSTQLIHYTLQPIICNTSIHLGLSLSILLLVHQVTCCEITFAELPGDAALDRQIITNIDGYLDTLLYQCLGLMEKCQDSGLLEKLALSIARAHHLLRIIIYRAQIWCATACQLLLDKRRNNTAIPLHGSTQCHEHATIPHKRHILK